MRTLQKAIIIFLMSILMISCTAMQSHAIVNVEISGGKVTLKDSGTGVTSRQSGFSKVIERYKELITFIGGLATMTFILIFIKHFIELGAKANNPMERRQIAGGLLWAGLAAAGLGSITFIFSVMYNVFK